MGYQPHFTAIWASRELECLTQHSRAKHLPLVKKLCARVQSQPLPSLLEPWTSGVEQNTVQHRYFRDEETEALGKAKTRIGTLALRSMLFYLFLVRVTPSAAKSFTLAHPQQGLVPIRCGKHRGPTSPCRPLSSSLPSLGIPMVFYPHLCCRMGCITFSSPEFFLHIN